MDLGLLGDAQLWSDQSSLTLCKGIISYIYIYFFLLTSERLKATANNTTPNFVKTAKKKNVIGRSETLFNVLTCMLLDVVAVEEVAAFPVSNGHHVYILHK